MYILRDLPAIQKGVLKEMHFSHPLRDSQQYVNSYSIRVLKSNDCSLITSGLGIVP
jgi:hypothetical protein